MSPSSKSDQMSSNLFSIEIAQDQNVVRHFCTNKESENVLEYIKLTYLCCNLSSLLLKMNDSVVGYVPVMTETVETSFGNKQVAQYLGLSLPPPLLSGKDQVLSAKADEEAILIQENAIRLAGAHQIRIAMYEDDGRFAQRRWLLRKRGYSSILHERLVLNLTKSLSELDRSMSKGHRADVRRWGRLLKTKFIKRSDYEQCLPFYRATLGADEAHVSWYEQMIFNELAELCIVTLADKTIGTAVFARYGRYAQYLLASRLTSGQEPVHTIAINAAMQKYKEEGCIELDLGVVTLSSTPSFLGDDKKLRLAKFKKGLGGDLRSLVVFERFLDRNVASNTLNDRVTRFLNSQEWIDGSASV